MTRAAMALVVALGCVGCGTPSYPPMRPPHDAAPVVQVRTKRAPALSAAGQAPMLVASEPLHGKSRRECEELMRGCGACTCDWPAVVIVNGTRVDVRPGASIMIPGDDHSPLPDDWTREDFERQQRENNSFILCAIAQLVTDRHAEIAELQQRIAALEASAP